MSAFLFCTASSSWHERNVLYCERQVSWLIASGFDSSASVSLPGFPVDHSLLAKYGDEFVQDSHLLPFSPDTYVRHLTHRYLIAFSLTTVSVAHRLFLCQVL